MIVTSQGLTEVLEYLDKQEELGVDSETTGLNYKDRLFSIQFSTQDRDFYLDKRILGDSFYKVRGLFARPRTWYFQNAKFDLRMLHWESMHPKGTISDLEVLARLDRNDISSTRLADTAKREGYEKLKIVDDYIDTHKLKTKRTGKYGTEFLYKHFDRVPVDIMGKYACHDTRITFDSSKNILARLDPMSLPVYKNECALTPICLEMEMRGALLDTAYTEKMFDYESGLIREAQSEFLLTTGKLYDTSKKALIEIFEKAGEIVPRTAKGNPSLTDEILESFTSPAARILQRIRHYEKRLSTYYSSFLDLAVDGVIHPDMRQAGTKTGRFSYRDPNLQNIPKEDEAEDLIRPNLIRRCFVPPPNCYIVSADFKAQEYRLMLAYARQQDLIDRVMAGMDLHEATAQLVGISRKQAKTLNFAILYGAGDDKLAMMLGITIQEARMLRQRYFMALPMVQHFINEVKRKVISRGFVYNWLGRKLHLPGNLPSQAYAVPNHIIQGGGADICKKAMVDVYPEIKGTGIQMFMQVHDSINFYVPEDQLDKLSKIKEVMENVFPTKNGMRMEVDIQISKKSMAEADMMKGMPNAG